MLGDKQETKQPISVRIGKKLLADVRASGVPITQAIEEGLRLWLARLSRRHRAKKKGEDNGDK